MDHFLRKLFGGVLSQAGFGYHRNFDLGARGGEFEFGEAVSTAFQTQQAFETR
ncbi:MAG: hypothetical protein U0V48_15045 [Anaerolineales bacterium]